MHCILIVGASGAGKDSLLKAAKAYFTQCNEKKPKVHFIPRYIDRIPDQNEANFYIDTQSFEILQDFFISKWRANSHNYGIAKHCLHKDGVNIISISRSAIKDFEAYCDNVSVIEVFVPLHILQHRLEQRGREDKAQIAKRLENAGKKTYAKNLYRFENVKPIEESAEEFICLVERIVDSALGNHSSDFVDFWTTADLKSSSAPKSTKNYESNTALVHSTSPYLQNLRILDSKSLESKADSVMVESRPCRGAEHWEKGDRSAAANAKLDRDKRGSPLDCQKSGYFFGAKGSGEGINPFLRKEKIESNNQNALLREKENKTLESNNCRDFSPLPHLSRKTSEAVQGGGTQAGFFSKKPTPKTSQAQTPNINNPSKILHFLGSSDSGGIPVHNCNCGACEEYRKQGRQNLSTSAFLQTESSEYILLDCGIEATATLFDGAKIRAIFLTHFHADHALGLLRLRYSKQHIVCYHPDDKQGFGDLFKHTKSIAYQALRPFIPIAIDSYTFTPIPLLHSKPTFGYFIQTPSENIAYLTDCAGLPQESLEFLQQKNIDICYIDAGAFVDSNGRKDSSNHLSHYEAADIIKALAPKQARLIHISHKILESLEHIHLPFEYVL